MLKDYLRASWRGVLHHKLHTLINVGGLALGLAVFIALSFYVHREFSWDAHWEGAERIYRVAGRQETPAGNSSAYFSGGPWFMGDFLQERHDDAFEVYVRVYNDYGTLRIDDEEFPQRQLNYAEPALLDLLQLETVAGSLPDVFADPRAIAISDRAADAIFGTRSPLGGRVEFSGQRVKGAEFTIKAVYRVPEPSTFAANLQFMALLDPAALPVDNVLLDVWMVPPVTMPASGRLEDLPPAPQQQPFNVTHYFKLQAGIAAAAIEADLRSAMDEGKFQNYGSTKQRYLFQPLRELHLMPTPFGGADSVQRLWVFAAVGALVLLISGCNFVMLATLRQVDRQRELGMRKTLGGTAGQLVLQQLLDAFCLSLGAAVLAVVLLQLALPSLRTLLDWPLQLELLNARSIGLVLLITVVFTLLSSTWPALMMARGRPVRLLRDGAGAALGGGTALRQLLVGIQFVIMVLLLLGTAVVWQQIEYTRTRDRGYSFDDVAGVRLNSLDAFRKAAVLVEELRRLPQVEAVASGGLSPGTVMISPGNRYGYTAADGSTISAVLQPISMGRDYFRVLSVPLLGGREFNMGDEAVAASGAEASSQVRSVLLNASALRELGFTHPEQAVGQLLQTDTTTPDGQTSTQVQRVVGVVADTQFSSVMLPPVPQIYIHSAQNSVIVLKLLPGTDRTALTAELRSIWEAVMGAETFNPIDPELLDANQLRREEFEARIISGSTLLAVIIALMGLYGLVSATVQRRVREIAVRKVLGAEQRSIVWLFLWQFSRPVLLANLVAWPCGLWVVAQWLQRFPFQLDRSHILLSALAASVAALLIAWLSVGLMTLRAAGANPAPALRSE